MRDHVGFRFLYSITLSFLSSRNLDSPWVDTEEPELFFLWGFSPTHGSKRKKEFFRVSGMFKGDIRKYTMTSVVSPSSLCSFIYPIIRVSSVKLYNSKTLLVMKKKVCQNKTVGLISRYRTGVE